MNKTIFAILFLGLSWCLFSCKEDEDSPKNAKRVTLVYAVNYSNLSYDYIDNERKMLEGLSGVDTDVFPFFVYKKDGKTAMLCRATRNKSGKVEMSIVKTYREDLMSSDPARLSEVIDDVMDRYQGLPATLFMWGHGTGWLPEFSTHKPRSVAYAGSPVKKDETVNYSFGGEGSSSVDRGDWMDLLEMADAIPSGVFETIWFDACYMSGIEVAYELRDKCRYFVAYPTEIYSDGLPYDNVLPKVVNDTPDLVAGAKILFDYYQTSGLAVTVAVMDMNNLPGLADVCREMISGTSNRPDFHQLKNYSRSSRYSLYDFGQMQKAYSALNGKTSLDDQFDAALDKFMMYKGCSNYDFANRPIDSDNFSGLNTHPFTDNRSKEDEYYKRTAWYKAVYE